MHGRLGERGKGQVLRGQGARKGLWGGGLRFREGEDREGARGQNMT